MGALPILLLPMLLPLATCLAEADDDPPAAPPAITPGEADRARPIGGSELRALIAQLGDPRFQVREEATQKLEQAGVEAVESLLEAATGEKLEITCRAIRALGAMLDKSDDATFDASQQALEKLEGSANRSASRRATVALAAPTVAVRRWNRAMTRFKELGGWVKVNERSEQAGQAAQQAGENTVNGNLMISRRWKGGDSGLIQIQRIVEALEDIGYIPENFPPVYVIDGAPVTPQGLALLRQAIPGLRLEARGEARLGVSFESGGRNCRVTGIERNSAAQRAGMRPGDIVVRYDGETLDGFGHLTDITRRHKVGDRVGLEILRGAEVVPLEAELSGWDDPEPKPAAK